MDSWENSKKREAREIVRKAVSDAKEEVDTNIKRRMEEALITLQDERRAWLAKGDLSSL